MSFWVPIELLTRIRNAGLRAFSGVAIALLLVACGDGSGETGAGTGDDRDLVSSYADGPSIGSAATFGGGSGATLGIGIFTAYPRSVTAGNQVYLFTANASDPSPGSTLPCEVAFTAYQELTLKADGSITGSGQAFLTQFQNGDRFSGYTLTKAPTSNNAFPTASFTPSVGGDTLITNPFVYRYCPAGVFGAGGSAFTSGGHEWGGFYPLADTIYYMHYYGTGGRVLVTGVVKVETPGWTLRCAGTGTGAGQCAFENVRGNGLVYIPSQGRLYSFGTDRGITDGIESWTERTVAAHTSFEDSISDLPANRAFGIPVYDESSQRVLYYSGTDDSDDRDTTFYYSPNSWTNGGAVSGAPGTRIKYGAAFAGGSLNRVLIWGGWDINGGMRTNTLYAWNGSANTWSQPGNTNAPAARWGHQMVWDNNRGRVIMFGGCVGGDADDDTGSGEWLGRCINAGDLRNDTWEYDPNGGSWAQMTTTNNPTARYGHTMYYDQIRRRVVMYAGCDNTGNECNNNGQLNDTWELDPRTGAWQNTGQAGPSGRYYLASAWHPARKSGFIYGGERAGTNGTETSTDLYERISIDSNQLVNYNLTTTWIAAGTTPLITPTWTTVAGTNPCSITSETSGWAASISSGTAVNLDGSGGGYDLRVRPNNNMLVDCGGGVRGDINVRREVEIRSFTGTPNPVVTSPSDVTLNWEIRAASQCRIYSVVEPGPIYTLLGTYNYNVNGTSPFGSHVLSQISPPEDGLKYEIRCDGYTSVGGGIVTAAKTRQVTIARPPPTFGGAPNTQVGLDQLDINPMAVNSAGETITVNWAKSTKTNYCDMRYSHTTAWTYTNVADPDGAGPKTTFRIDFGAGINATQDLRVGNTIELWASAWTTLRGSFTIANIESATRIYVNAAPSAASGGWVLNYWRLAVSPYTMTPSETKDFEFICYDNEGMLLLVTRQVRVNDQNWGRIYETGPSGRNGHKMVFDAYNNRVLLHGGWDGAYKDDTWTFNGLKWTQRASSGAARAQHGLIYDSSRQRVVAYDGENQSGGTYEYNVTNNTWANAGQTIGDDRDFLGMAFDASRNETVIHGGHNSNSLGRTWRRSSGAWAEACRPLANCGPSYTVNTIINNGDDESDMETGNNTFEGDCDTFGICDAWSPFPANGNIVQCNTTYAVVEQYLNNHGVLLTYNPPSEDCNNTDNAAIRGNWIPATTGPSLTYDSARSRVLAFGGVDLDGAYWNSVWEWNGAANSANGNWASKASFTTARRDMAMAYDAGRQRHVMFGGYNGGILGDLQEMDAAANTWATRGITLPSARYRAAMAYDNYRKALVLYGGNTAGTGTDSETWEYPRRGALITGFNAERVWIPAGFSGTVNFSWTASNVGASYSCQMQRTRDWASWTALGGTANGVNAGSITVAEQTDPANYYQLACGHEVATATAYMEVRREVDIQTLTATPAVVTSPLGDPVTLNWTVKALNPSTGCTLWQVDQNGNDIGQLGGTFTSTSGSHNLGTVNPPLEGNRYQLRCNGYTAPGTAGVAIREIRVGRASSLSLSSSTVFAAPGGAANLTWATSYVTPNSCALGTAAAGWMWFAYNTQPTDGDRVLLSDYQSPPYRVIFEFDSGGGVGGAPPGVNQVVAVTIGGSASATRDNFVAAINANAPLKIQAASSIGAPLSLSDSGSSRFALWTDDAGAVTNLAAITISQTGAGRLMASGTNLSGGIDEDDYGGTLPVNWVTPAPNPLPFPYDMGAVPAVPMLVCSGFDAAGNYGRMAARLATRMIHRKVEPLTFAATPFAVPVGTNSLSLNWNVVGAIQGTSCLLSGPGDSGGTITNVQSYPFPFLSPPASPPYNPPVTFTDVNPVPETKYYRLSCTGDGTGNTFATSSTPPVIYEDAQIFRRAEITSFTATPATAYPGSSLNFAWTTAAISPGSCSINNGVGIVADSSAGYPVTVNSPPTTYTLTCNGDGSAYATQHGGPVTAELTIDRNVETTSLVAEPVAVSPGGQSTLIYETVNAINCAVDDTYPHAAGGIMAPATVPVPSGSWPTPALPSLPQTFYIVCSGTGTDDVKSVTVYRAAQINSFTVDQAAVHPGTTVQFSWSTSFTQANGCSISGTGGAGQNLPTTGTLNFVVATPPTSYVLTCLAVNGNPAVSSPVSVQRRVEVTGFTASPNPVVPGFGTTFTFTTVNATSCWIDDPPYTAPRLYDASITPQLPNGTQAHTFPLAAPPSGIIYRMQCSGIGADHYKDFTVMPPSVVTISNFSATPTSVLPGGSTSLTWGSYSPTGTHTCQITGAAASLPLSGQSGTSVSSGAIASPPAVLTLTCQRGGDPNAVQTLTIERRVQINSFTATPGTIIPFTQSTLAWSVTNATDCDIDGSSGFGPVVVPSGSMVISGAGTSPLNRTYTLTCRGPGGPVSQNVTINEYAGTAIHTFTANPSSINLGEVVQLSWNTHRSTSCSINNGVGAVAVGLVGNPMVPATANVTPASLPITYTLTCNGTGTPSSANANVTITDKGWVQVTSGLSGASSRDGAAGVYDPDRSRVYVMGGYSSSRGHLDDLWEWDGSTWTERCSSSVAPVEACDTTKPSARYRHAMAYDNGPARDRVVLFGGYSDDYGYLYDTWTWNAATGAWTQANDGSGAAYCDDYMNGAATSPAPRVDASMTFDASQNLVILYGGYCEGYVMDDIWSWNGTAWSRITPTTTNAPCPTARPEKRFGHTLAYDSGRSRHVLYGGMGLNASDQPVYYPTAANGFTWEMQYTGGQWQWFCTTPADPNADGNPAPRRWASSAYDSAQSRTILFGGEGSDGVTLYNDTWAWYNNGGMTWRKILGEFPALAPRARATMVYDAAIAPRLDLLLISGTSAASADPVGDFWKWSP